MRTLKSWDEIAFDVAVWVWVLGGLYLGLGPWWAAGGAALAVYLVLTS